MNRKLTALNIALALLVVAAGWRLWVAIDRGDKRYEAMVGLPLEPAALPEAEPIPVPGPVQAATYSALAQQVLFFSDRNPNVVIEVAAPKPLPPMPVAHGVLDIGSGPTVILSSSAGGSQKGYRAGDTFGEFKIVQVAHDRLLLDWEGQRLSRTIDQLKPQQEDRAPPPVSTAANKPKPTKPKGSVIGAVTKPGPGDVDMGSGIMSCKPGDESPAGTVVNGYKKVVTATPFGRVCRWEPGQ